MLWFLLSALVISLMAFAPESDQPSPSTATKLAQLSEVDFESDVQSF